MVAPHPQSVVDLFDVTYAELKSARAAARVAGVSEDWAYNRVRGRKKRDQAKFYAVERELMAPKPKPGSKLRPEAVHALECFACFRLRFIGRSSAPWAVEAANEIVRLLATDDREYAVINAPPGVGKTSLFTHDIPLWLICRDRNIKILIGAAIQVNATKHSNRLRRSLSALQPAELTDDDAAKGMVKAASTVSRDYGGFKPDAADLEAWTATAFTVAQLGVASVADKEPTVQAYGRKGGVLGNRVKFCIWDDLVTPDNMRTVEARDEMQVWWKSVAETRINAGGLIILQGQRMAPDDLYRFALDLKGIVLDEDGFEDLDAVAPMKYKHIVYRAHYEDLCSGAHPKGLKPWPASCLLDPRMVPWKTLAMEQKNDMANFRTVYQQEDAEASQVLAPKLWISGGSDDDGVYPGCWDKDRGAWELPKFLTPPVHVFATVDPSPTRWWGVQAWAWNPASEQLFLLDLIRERMTTSDFLDFDPLSGELSGLAVEFQERSERLGFPLRTWIVESNSIKGFFTTTSTRRFLQKFGVRLLEHTTSANKTDPRYGVWSMRSLFRQGRVRLPGRQDDVGRLASLKLVDEVTRWSPHTQMRGSDDQVMSMWFGFWNLQRFAYADAELYQLPGVPSYLARSARRGLEVVA